MRTRTALAVAATLPVLLSGCLAELVTTTAIQGTLQAQQMNAASSALNYAKNSQAEIGVNQAIQAFAAENGRYPASLEELVPEWMPAVPAKPDGSAYGYDPATGKLLDAPPAAAPAPRPSSLTNEQKMAQISAAIVNYGAATGYYPGTLDALVPGYLPALPLTANRARFIYDPQTGQVYDPTGTVADVPVPGATSDTLAQPAPQQQQSGFQQPRATGVGGGSPMLGETLTGIGISNQLDNMSTAGSSAAGSAARAGARGVGAGHDAAQQRAMDDLGL